MTRLIITEYGRMWDRDSWILPSIYLPLAVENWGWRKVSVGKLCDSAFEITVKPSCSEITSTIGFSFAILVFQKDILVRIINFFKPPQIAQVVVGVSCQWRKTPKTRKKSHHGQPWMVVHNNHGWLSITQGFSGFIMTCIKTWCSDMIYWTFHQLSSLFYESRSFSLKLTGTTLKLLLHNSHQYTPRRWTASTWKMIVLLQMMELFLFQRGAPYSQLPHHMIGIFQWVKDGQPYERLVEHGKHNMKTSSFIFLD